MIILDPNGMPVNLGQTTREDYPEALFPIMAYDGKNVIPTALGYRSFFGEDKKFNVGTLLNGKLVQQVFVFQTIAMSTLMVALAEDGIYVSNATEEDTQFPWLKIVDTSAGQAEGVRRLWTYCVISNIVYFYQQGSDGFYGLVDPAKYAETTIPEVITGASITQIWLNTDLQVGLLKYKPNFINMAGQLGIFKAANRLGFWDSENAVAWSSATQVYDFKPSTTTFAGVTTFVDVVGNITTIKQHGNGFIIYASKSVTLVLPLSGSPERWTGRAIFSDVGVVFDIQVAVGQPDTVHFAITSGGLARIENGDPQFIQPEVMDYVRQNNELYALTVVESRYLFIHTAAELDDILAPSYETVLPDSTGNYYAFPNPDPVVPEDAKELITQYVNGTNAAAQAEFSEAQEPISGVIVPSDKALIPCFTGHGYHTNVDEFLTVFSREVFVELESVLSPGSIWNIKLREYRPNYDIYYYEASKRFIDKAGQEYLEVMQDSVNRLVETNTIQVNVSQQMSLPDLLQLATPITGQGPTQTLVSTGIPWPQATWTWENLIEEELLIPAFTECSQVIKAAVADITYAATVDMTEELAPIYNVELGTYDFHYIGTSGLVRIAEPVIILRDKLTNALAGYMPLDSDMKDLMVGTHGVRHANNGWPVFWPSGNSSQDTEMYARSMLNTTPPTPSNKTYYTKGQMLGPRLAKRRGANPAGSWVESPNSPENWVAPNGCATIDGNSWDHLGSVDGGWLGGGSALAAWKRVETRQYVRDGSDVCSTTSTGRLSDYRTITPVNLYPTNNSQGFSAGTSNLTPDQIVALEEAANYVPKTLTLKELTLEVTPEYSKRSVEDCPVIFEAEVDGYGYVPLGGSFRKTHTRSIFKPCSPAQAPGLTFPGNPAEDLGDIDVQPAAPTPLPPVINPPYQWQYPPAIPLPDNYIMFKKGSLSPYYQTYEEAIVLDLQLEKWGLYSNPHKTIYSLYPVNRTDQSIVPVQDYGLRAGALNTEGLLSMFTHENPDSSISYGKIGDYRKGVTGASNVVADFAKKANCYLIVEASLNGDFIDPALSQGITVVDSLRAELPFTATAKWFNIRFEGTFDLKGLSFESSSKGRR